MRAVTFDGFDLARLVYVEDVRRPLYAGLRVQTETVPGADGCLVRSAMLDSMEVEVDVRCIRPSKVEMRRVLGELARVLAVDGPRRLTQSDRPGLYDLAVPTGRPSVDEWMGTGGATLTFLLPSPASYGPKRAATVGTAGAGFQVFGTYRTAPVLSCPAAMRDKATGLWGVRLDGGDTLRVALADTKAHRVEVDCTARTATVDGAAAMVTLDSDWWSLDAGRHTATVELGTGDVEMTWNERWL